ncbi:MAG TPA: rRNA adenine N-6-methyltransferase family protein [Phycisphaerae bacterium]|jgi:phospholipid N-methyltransferase|nr:rRNA adenine N-6-methyltransferase family protein [Phycisphaerae bacterium]
MRDPAHTAANHTASSHARASASPRRPGKARMRENFLFLSKFFKHGVTIASIWPSSPALSKATIKQIDWATARVVVELGAGTGPITEQIIKRLRPGTTFIAIERDHDFARILQRRFAGHENVHIVQGDVRDLDPILKKFNIESVDAFVSGLPTPSLPKPVRRRMLAAVRRYLVDGGVFSNITEVPFWYWRYYKNVFEKVRFDLVMANMPPGGVYHCWACK